MHLRAEPAALPDVVARLRTVLGEPLDDAGRSGAHVVTTELEEPGNLPDGPPHAEPHRVRDAEVAAPRRDLAAGAASFGGPIAAAVLRWRLSRPAARGLVLLLAFALAASAWLVLRSLPRAASPVVVPAVPAPSTPVRAAASAAATALIVVDVVGPVVRPGIVRVPDGSRVIDVIRAAGGLRKGASSGSVNLARKVADGEQVVVGQPAGAATAGGTVGAPDVLDLNSATVDQLDQLPHVGPVLAQRVVDWRDAHGRFTSVDELREIAGIGSRIFAEISSRVRV